VLSFGEINSGVARIWCQGGHNDRGAEGASIEAPSGVGYGEGSPLRSRLGGLVERRELPPSEVRGGAPAAVAFSAYFRHTIRYEMLF